MGHGSGYRPPATTVRCDNPKCNALYEISNMLGGHTFTCNRCGSKVTIRDLSFQPASSKPRASFKWNWPRPSDTPILDSIVSGNQRRSMFAKVLLFVTVLGLAVLIAYVLKTRGPQTRPIAQEAPIPALIQSSRPRPKSKLNCLEPTSARFQTEPTLAETRPRRAAGS
jgi:hypothetical protein